MRISGRRAVPAVVALLILAAPALGAQRLSPPPANEGFPAEPNVSHPLLAGAGLGAAGFLAGALVGYSTVRSRCNQFPEDFCGLPESFYGAAIGGTFGMAVGVHLGNRRRGNLGVDFLTGAAIWAVGIGVVAASDWDGVAGVAAFIAVPIAQLAATTAIERSIGRKHERARGATVSLIPTRRGIGLSASMPLPRIR